MRVKFTCGGEYEGQVLELCQLNLSDKARVVISGEGASWQEADQE